jgi:Xaa-Pro aminopeptidase
MKNPTYFEIPREEYDSRLAKLRTAMGRENIDAMIFLCPENIGYYSGFRRTWIASQQEYGLIVTKEGKKVLFIPWLNSQTVSKTSWVEDIRTWKGSKSMGLSNNVVEVINLIFKDLKLDKKMTIGAELGGSMYMNISYNDFRAVIEAFPKTSFVDASKLIWEQRKIKSDFEISIIRRLGEITTLGLKEGIEAIKPGMTERELSEIIWHRWISEGAFDSPMQGQGLMRTGRASEGALGRYNCVCTRPIDFPIEKNEGVFFDGGPSYKGYMSDIQRMVFLGEPTDMLLDLVKTGENGMQSAIAILRAGTKISDIYKAAVNGMEAVNPGSRDKYPITFVGHSIGLNIHEKPWLIEGENSRLEEGMVISLEVGAYDAPDYRTIPGFPEDMFLITKDGYENLTDGLSRDLWIVET